MTDDARRIRDQNRDALHQAFEQNVRRVLDQNRVASNPTFLQDVRRVLDQSRVASNPAFEQNVRRVLDQFRLPSTTAFESFRLIAGKQAVLLSTQIDEVLRHQPEGSLESVKDALRTTVSPPAFATFARSAINSQALPSPSGIDWPSIADVVAGIDAADLDLQEAVDAVFEDLESDLGPELSETAATLKAQYGTVTCRTMIVGWLAMVWASSLYLVAITNPDAADLVLAAGGVTLDRLVTLGWKVSVRLFPDVDEE